MSASSFLSATERILVVKSVPGFEQVETYSMRQLVPLLEERYFRRDERLMTQGEPLDECFFVIQGSARIDTLDGDDFRIEGPASIGLWSILSGATGAPSTVVAERDLLALTFERRAVLKLWESNFDLLSETLQFVACAALGERGGLPFDPDDPPPVLVREEPTERLDIVDKLDVLANNSAYRGANLDALAEICRSQREVRLPHGHLLWEQGDPSGHALRVLAGSVAFERDGAEVGRVGADYSFGLVESLADEKRQYTARVDEPAVLLKTDVTNLLEVSFDHFDLATRLYRIIRSETTSEVLVC